jgi:hypothetical protein
MSLTSLVRWIGVVMIGWTLLAIGIGASGTRLSRGEAPVFLPAASPMVEAMPTSWPNMRHYDLVDRTNGRRTPLRLPDGDRWSAISISPRLGAGGELEAVGQWINPDRDDFGGWGVFRLSDGAVLSRIATEILPSGRPCWVPDQSRMILFTAGDGRLYRCRLSEEEGEPVVRRPSIYASGRTEPSEPLAWEIAPPGYGEPMLEDPAWSSHPRLRKWVFVALMPLQRRDQRLEYGVTHLWWLEVSDDASAIVAAGPLTGPTGEETAPVGIEERFPNVTVGPDGNVRLVYLERRIGERTVRLRSATVDFDQQTGRPKALTGFQSPIPKSLESLKLAPLLLSADGATVHGLSLSGQLAAWPCRCREVQTASSTSRGPGSSQR